MVTTASAPAIASPADAARAQPRASARSNASSDRSKATTSCPALARFAAMPPPILPRPINATRAMIFHSLLTLSPCGRGQGEGCEAKLRALPVAALPLTQLRLSSLRSLRLRNQWRGNRAPPHLGFFGGGTDPPPPQRGGGVLTSQPKKSLTTKKL